MELVEIQKINFGFADGKNEALESNFEELFYEDGNYYKKLRDNHNFIISGRKGTGKTTLAYYFIKQKENEKKTKAKMMFANDFMEKKLLSFANDPVNKEEMMTFWKYVFLLELGNMIVEESKELSFIHFFRKKKVKKLKNILVNEHYTINEIVSSQSVGSQSSLSSKFNPVSPEINANNSITSNETNTSHLKKAKYYESIKKLEKEVFSLLKDNANEYYIFYDDMDQLEEYMEIEDFKNLTKSMIYAAEKMNHEIRYFNKSKICLVMRSDILNLLHEDSNNLNKTISDFGIEISWFNPNVKAPLEHPLMQMILHKIKKSVDIYMDKPIEVIFDALFGDNKDILDFMMKRSLGRPRDIIQYFNIHKGLFPHSKSIIFDQLTQSEASYSSWFYNELMNEIKIDKEVDEIIKLINLIVERGYPTFKFAQIKELNEKTEEKNKVSNLLATLEKMRNLGILGIITKKGKMEFSYRDNKVTRVTISSKFSLNYGLRKYMNL